MFERDAINLGLLVLVSPDAAKLVDSAMVQFDLASATVRIADGTLLAECELLPKFLLEIVRDGGLIHNLKRRIASRLTA